MPGHANVRAPFKYTLPITRAFEQNGELFIRGEASGPEVDVFDTRMDPSLIESFARQIEERNAEGQALIYRDTHNPDGVLTELGELVEASVTDQQHLFVTVKLFRKNPASQHLYDRLLEGKKYGMSVGGTVVDYVDEYVESLGRSIRRFTNVVLDHIANTTMPAWTPSLGTVLARAVDRAISEGASMEDELAPAPETPVEDASEPTPETPSEEAAPESGVTEEAVAETEESTEESPEVHMIPLSALQPIQDAVAALASAFASLTATPAPAPVALSAAGTDAARSVESESPVTSDLDVLRTDLASLRTELANANDRIRQLEAEPAGSQPPVIERVETNLTEELKKLSPHERLLIGLQAAQAANQ